MEDYAWIKFDDPSNRMMIAKLLKEARGLSVADAMKIARGEEVLRFDSQWNYRYWFAFLEKQSFKFYSELSPQAPQALQDLEKEALQRMAEAKRLERWRQAVAWRDSLSTIDREHFDLLTGGPSGPHA